MKIEINTMSPEDLRFFIDWATNKKNHYEKLVSELKDALENQAQVQFPFSIETTKVESSNGQMISDRTINKIIQVLSAHGGWLSNGELRDLLEEKEGIKLSSNGMRAHLQKHEGKYFQRKGENKYTKWRTIVESVKK